MTPDSPTLAPLESRILSVRGQAVLIDADLADVYAVSTKALNQAVKRNAERFPLDFRFPLTPAEREEVVTGRDHLARLRFSPTMPWAFTEHGAIMAASVLNSPRAVQMSVFVVRAFVKLREIARNHVFLEKQLLMPHPVGRLESRRMRGLTSQRREPILHELRFASPQLPRRSTHESPPPCARSRQHRFLPLQPSTRRRPRG